ncbi:MAG TPA: alanine--tRNA ligase [Deltaproteobacteria bacterium]|nr:alanine--tRNA ligase [Deltaproteobacteria bacterium]
MKSAELRESFLKYFESKGHRRVKSSPLIPERDPTLFFTNAGMVPFKNVFLGQEDLGTRRATSSQKCMRVSGKHNDLENVGRTHRHHTFFEMLGNFSFGDYFKKEAIAFAWEYLTEVLKLDKSRLWVTVFREDDEAEKLWKELTDVDTRRLLRMDEADNFWSMGETGPCGPCTEIHYDFDGAHGKTPEEFRQGSDSGRIMEIWNLVFMQFNRFADGSLKPLPKPSVDTGMGLERLACVVQGVYSNYDSDLFTPLLAKAAELSGKKYGSDGKTDISMRVIADHIRASGFLVSDGVLPSNEGRGYVLRRILRRAIRHGRKLGLHEPFFFKMIPVLIHEMGKVYPELVSNQKFIEEVIRAEEARFLETLEKGLEIIESEIARVRSSGKKMLSGVTAFRLYDTYGFPLDLTETIATEAGLAVDHAEFEERMEAQRETARAAWKGSGEVKTAEIHQQLASEGLKTEFLGYQTLDCISKITAILQKGRRVQEAQSGDEVEIYCEFSPFYAEAGGQVGDQGQMIAPQALAEIKDTQRPVPDLTAHFAKVLQGRFKVGDEVHLQVHRAIRAPTMLNHTATHLLHAALRRVLGDHVKQAGSLVAPERLRFDFSHFQPMTREQILAVEDLVNEKIREDIEVCKSEMNYDAAIQSGAMALFGEKYGDKVRVLKIEDFSTELCGGTHVDRTGEIGLFKILGESSVAAGVRRIEAVTGSAAFFYLRDLEEKWNALARKLKVTPEEMPEKVERQAELVKKLEKESAQLKAKLAGGGAASADFMQQVRESGGVKVLVLRRDIEDLKSLREFSDQVKNKLGSGVSVIGSASEGKATLIVRVSKDLASRFDAGKLAKELAALVGGSGGGKAEMAQAGGPKVEALDHALERVYELIA